MSSLALFLTVFIACAVEAVEALTIVLAAGLTREWRSTFQGMAAALVVLAVTVAVLGPALTLVPLTALRLVVGALLAVFGLQWLREAILRASGYKGLHDEEAIYARQVAAAQTATGGSRRGVRDWPCHCCRIGSGRGRRLFVGHRYGEPVRRRCRGGSVWHAHRGPALRSDPNRGDERSCLRDSRGLGAFGYRD